MRVGIIGTGRMAAILARAAARFAPDAALSLAGRNAPACEALRRETPSVRIESAEAVAGSSDLLILAVPPDAYLGLLADLKGAIRPGAIVVSLANGVPLQALGAATPNPIVKVIPTMAQSVGRGIVLVMAGPRAGEAEIRRVTAFFGAFGRPVLVDDRDSRVASNVAGSFLALAAALTDTFVAANAARAETLDRAALGRMAADTLGGVAALVAEGHDYADIVHATATPGGVTAAALEVLGQGFPALAAEAVAVTFSRQAAMRDSAGGDVAPAARPTG